MKAIKLIRDYTHAVKAMKLIQEYSAEMHRDNLKQLDEFYDSIFEGYDKYKVARALVNEAGLYYLHKLMKKGNLNEN